MTIDLKAIEERLHLCREDVPDLIAAVKERDADASAL
jgi:hypothetical protein